MSGDFPLPPSTPAALGLAVKPLAELDRLIRRQIDEGYYPGCQIALARHGRLALFRTYGDARRDPARLPARDDTLWPLLSSTKVPMTAAFWSLLEDGTLSLSDRVAEHIPEFARHGKDAITLHQVATHQAGLPNAAESRAAWLDHSRMREEICDFRPEWAAGSRMAYHDRSAHLILAMVIEAATGSDYRDIFRQRIVAPLGLGAEFYLGVPRDQQHRCADFVVPEGFDDAAPPDNSAERRAAGLPHGGGYATARAMAAFYQMLLRGGRRGAARLVAPRTIDYATRNHTGERPDESMGGVPMHRGIGPHQRGESDRTRGLGTLASPATYGHGGFRSSYCWADPVSGVSFAYLTNGLAATSYWHYQRLDRISNLVHAAID